MSCTRTITLACVFLELFPFDYFRYNLCPLYNLKTIKDFSMILGTLVNHDDTMCHAQEP